MWCVICVCVCACLRGCGSGSGSDSGGGSCVCACSPVCVHGAREQLRKKEKKKGKLTWKKVPTVGFEPVASCCGATVLSSALLSKC